MVKKIIGIALMLVIGALAFQNCGEIRLTKGIADEPSVQETPTPILGGGTPPPLPPPPATWKTETINQVYCTANYGGPTYPGGDKSTSERMICKFLQEPTKQFILAPEMKYFIGFGLPGEPAGFDGYQHQKSASTIPQFYLDSVTAFNVFQAKINFKITYKKISGPSDILVPFEKGAFFTASAPVTDGDWVYEAQMENSYGVSPVKTIKFKVQKPVYAIGGGGNPVCAGIAFTGMLDLTPYLGTRFVSKIAGKMSQSDAHIIKFKMPSKGWLKTQSSNSWMNTSFEFTVSTHPCDFVSGVGTFMSMHGVTNFERLHTVDMLIPGKYYYINVKPAPGACDPVYSDCSLPTDFSFSKVDVSDKGNPAHMVNNMTSGCYDYSVPWDPVAGDYDYTKMVKANFPGICYDGFNQLY